MNKEIIYNIFKEDKNKRWSKIALTEEAYQITNANSRMAEFASVSSMVGSLYKQRYLNKEYKKQYVYYFFRK